MSDFSAIYILIFQFSAIMNLGYLVFGVEFMPKKCFFFFLPLSGVHHT